MAIILWAHRQRLSCTKPTRHQPPPSGCTGVTAASSRTTNAPRPSPYHPLRRTRLTLIKDNLPNRLPSQRPSQRQPRLMPPYRVNPMPAGRLGRPRQPLYRRNPIASQRFAHQWPPTNKMRPAHAAQRQNTSTLRRSGSFVFGQQST